jgi:hypothetical protein
MSLIPLPAPPKGFRPTAATDAELAQYGFPPRPPGRSNARRMWTETFGRDVPYVVAKLAQASHFASRPRQPSIVNGNNSANWCGVVIQSQAGDPINLGIAATWNVPSIASVGDGTQQIALWIGIDGFGPNNLGLLQAGIVGSFDASGVPAYSAWTEWLSAADPVQQAHTISDLQVHADDIINAQIWVTSPTTATVVMQNLSAASQAGPIIVPLSAPAGVRVLGNDAEWIVERPEVGQARVPATLPSYSPVNFTQAAAWSQAAGNMSTNPASFKSFAIRSGFAMPVGARAVAASLDFTPPISLREMTSETAVMFAGSGQTIAMNENGAPFSLAEIQGKDSLRCEYVGLQPGSVKSGGPPLHLQTG